MDPKLIALAREALADEPRGFATSREASLSRAVLALAEEIERLKATLEDAIAVAESVPAQACGAFMLRSPQIGESTIESWRAALRGKEK